MTLERMDIVWTVVTVLIVLNLVVSVRVLISGAHGWGQKIGQLVLVWIVPLFGAILVHSFLATDGTAPRKEPGFLSDGGNNPPGIQ